MGDPERAPHIGAVGSLAPEAIIQPQTAGGKMSQISVSTARELRLECLKLAVAHGRGSDPRVEAEALFDYVLSGINPPSRAKTDQPDREGSQAPAQGQRDSGSDA